MTHNIRIGRTRLAVRDKYISFKDIDTVSIYRCRNLKLVIAILLAGALVLSLSMSIDVKLDGLVGLSSLLSTITFFLTLLLGWLAWHHAWGGANYTVYLYGGSLFLPRFVTKNPVSFDEAENIALKITQAILADRPSNGSSLGGVPQGTTEGANYTYEEPVIAGNRATLEQLEAVVGGYATGLRKLRNVRVESAAGLFGIGLLSTEVFLRWLYPGLLLAAVGVTLFVLIGITAVAGFIPTALSGWMLGFVFGAGAILVVSYWVFSLLGHFRMWHLVVNDGAMSRILYKSEDKDQAEALAGVIKSLMAGGV